MIPDATPWWVVGLVALVFACVGFLAIQLSASVCKTIVPFDDGPTPGRPPTTALVIGAGVIGGLIAFHVGLTLQLLTDAFVIFALVAVWYSDVICGIIPDYFTLVPLAILVGLRVFLQDWQTLIVTLAVTLTFGLAAFFSKGRGMGWGDVKLVALGAVVLGSRSLLAFAAACLAAVIVAAIRRKRSEPVAFAPYLAASIATALALPTLFPSAGV